MKQNKTIIFKIAEFPHLSETFVIAQIITAINLGYDIKLIIVKLLDINQSSHLELLNKYGILQKIIIEDYKVPHNKAIRLATWAWLFITNIKNSKQIVSFYKLQNKFSLTWLFQWCFYKKFNDAAIFHIQYGTNKSPIDLLKKTGFFRPAVVVTFHGHDAFFPINGFIPNNNYYGALFKHCDLITANTPYLQEKILELGCPNQKLKVIPVGVDTAFFYPNNISKKHQETLRLITVGRLDPVKGQMYCIEALRLLILQSYKVTLTIVGDGAEKNNLENLIQEYQLQEHVFMLGRKSQVEIRQLLWEHDLYLLAAVALPDGRRETQGLATLEAQACQLPVVAFDSGGVKYTISNNTTGFVVPEYDVKEMASKIEILYNNRKLLQEMSNNTTEFINSNYSQNHIDTLWQKIYSEL